MHTESPSVSLCIITARVIEARFARRNGNTTKPRALRPHSPEMDALHRVTTVILPHPTAGGPGVTQLNRKDWLLTIASMPVMMALSVLTWLLWNMLRGIGGWK